MNCSYKLQLDQLSLQINEANINIDRVIDLLKVNKDLCKAQNHTQTSFIGNLTRVIFGSSNKESEIELEELIKISTDATTIAKLLHNQTECIMSEFGSANMGIAKLEEITNNFDYKNITTDTEFSTAISILFGNIMQLKSDAITLIDSVMFV